MQYVYHEDGRFDVPIDYYATAMTLWEASKEAMQVAFPELFEGNMTHLIQMGVDHDRVERKLVSYQTMEARIQAAERQESSKEQQNLSRKLVMEEAGASRDGVWFETFEGPLVILYTVTHLYLLKTLGYKGEAALFKQASVHIKYREEEKESNIDDYIIGIDRAIQQEAGSIGSDVVEKKLAFRDFVAKGLKMPVMPKRDYLSLWRLLRLDEMSAERKEFREKGDKTHAFREKIDVIIDPDLARREKHIKQVLERGDKTDVDARLELAQQQAGSPHEVMMAQLHHLEQLIQSGTPTESKAEKYGSAFLVAIAAGIALIFWEAVV